MNQQRHLKEDSDRDSQSQQTDEHDKVVRCEKVCGIDVRGVRGSLRGHGFGRSERREIGSPERGVSFVAIYIALSSFISCNIAKALNYALDQAV